MDNIDLLARELGFNRTVKGKDKGRKKMVPFPINSIEATLDIVHRYKDVRARKAFTWLYLTGQRVSEMLAQKRSQVWFDEEGGKEYIIVDSLTEKNREKMRRIIPIPVSGKEEEAARNVMAWMERIPMDEKIVNFGSRSNIWNLLSKVRVNVPAIDPKTRQVADIEMKVYPHYMRHLRASHLAMHYNYDLVKLMNFFGWASPSMANVYVSMNWRSLARPFETFTKRPEA